VLTLCLPVLRDPGAQITRLATPLHHVKKADNAAARQNGGTGGDQAPEGSGAAEITRRPSLTSTCKDVPTSKPASASH